MTDYLLTERPSFNWIGVVANWKEWEYNAFDVLTTVIVKATVCWDVMPPTGYLFTKL